MRIPQHLLILILILLFAVHVTAQRALPKGEFNHCKTDSLRFSDFRKLLSGIYKPDNNHVLDHIQKKASGTSFLRSVSFSQYNRESPQSSQCADTSARISINKNGYQVLFSSAFSTSDGNILLAGWEMAITGNLYSYPILVKAKYNGDIIWTRRLYFDNPSPSGFAGKVYELSDGSIILIGNLAVPSNIRNDLFISKLSASGGILWAKTFTHSLAFNYTTDGTIKINDCKDDAKGNIYMCGNLRVGSPTDGALLFGMNENGNVLWSKKFVTDLNPSFSGIDISNDTIRVFGLSNTSSNLAILTTMVRIVSGNVLESKTFATTGENARDSSFNAEKLTKLNNGNFAVYGSGFTGYFNPDNAQPVTHYGLVEFSPALIPVRATLFQSGDNNLDNYVISVFKDGSATYGRNYRSSNSADTWIVGNYEKGDITKERSIPYQGIVPYATSDFLQSPGGGWLAINSNFDPVTQLASNELIKFNNSDTAGSCLGSDTTLTTLQPFFLSERELLFDSIVSNVLIETFHPFDGVNGDTLQIGSNCKQITYCDSLKLIPSLSNLCLGTPVSITIRKNKACGAFPAFSYDTSAVQSFYRVNDTTVSLSFNKQYQGYITASINGCQPVSDSVQFTVTQASPALNLGPDTVICPGNIIALNAKSGYASYHWQDGSADSVFTITQPGKYYVTTANACGGSFSDTVIAASHPPIPFDVGIDMSLCKGDSAVVTAPSGFISYQWSPSSGINTVTGQTVTISPRQDTKYKVTAEQTQGCFASDSFNVVVKRVPAISLGSDTSLCQGQSLLLSAGAGFSSYKWSTGAVSSTITVNTAGTFSVKATANGCSTADTLLVNNVYPLPSFSLGNDTVLCTGQQLQYAFSFQPAAYQWSNGSVSNTQTITQPGLYWLNVTRNNCRFADTVQVVYNPAPVFSLGNDTTVCQGITLLLQASVPGASYHWQDGNSTNNYLVSKAGLYILTAKLNKCTAADSIMVRYKPLPYFSLGKDAFLCLGQQLLLQPLFNVLVGYTWQDGSTAPAYTVTTSGSYTLTATGDCGSYTDSVTITTGACKLVMPSAFTPGNDGLNDVFRVKYPFPARTFHLAVFTRWGQMVFQTNDIAKGWNGTINSFPASQGAYIWQISYTGNEGKWSKAAGTVTLIR